MPTLYTSLRAQHRERIVAPKEQSFAGAKALPIRVAEPLLKAETRMLTTSAKSATRTPRRQRPAKRVIIVGAGLAGLCAGYELHGLGQYDVTVYEARDHVGGRVNSPADFIPGKTVEAGGELIGRNHPLWHSYKVHFRLRFTDVKDYGNSPVRFGRRTLTFEQAKVLTDELEQEFEAINRLAETIVDPFEPWTNHNAAHLDAISLAAWIKKEKCSRLCKQALADMLEADNGVPGSEQSLLGVLAMVKGGGLDRYWTDTEVFRCAGGNQQLAEKFTSALNQGRTRVVLNAPVLSVGKRASDVAVQVVVHGKSVTAFADELILAVPPSVWSRIRFQDSALARKLAIPPGMGKNVKYLMRFKDRFWEQFASSPTLSEDGPVDLTWETTEADKLADFAMVAFSGSDDAKQCLKWKPGDRARQYVKSLQAAYPGIGAQILHSRFVSWPEEEWTRASYSFPRPNEVTTWGPIWKNGYDDWLHFAGEHTCYAFVGYMEGALNSGYRLARKIAIRDGFLRG